MRLLHSVIMLSHLLKLTTEIFNLINLLRSLRLLVCYQLNMHIKLVGKMGSHFGVLSRRVQIQVVCQMC